MKTSKKHIWKHILSTALTLLIIISSIATISKPSEAYAAKRYNPSGEWLGKNEALGGSLEISMYSDVEDDDTVVGNWRLSNYFGYSEGVIKKTSNKNKYKLVSVSLKSGRSSGPTYFTMTMKSSKN